MGLLPEVLITASWNIFNKMNFCQNMQFHQSWSFSLTQSSFDEVFSGQVESKLGGGRLRFKSLLCLIQWSGMKNSSQNQAAEQGVKPGSPTSQANVLTPRYSYTLTHICTPLPPWIEKLRFWARERNWHNSIFAKTFNKFCFCSTAEQ